MNEPQPTHDSMLLSESGEARRLAHWRSLTFTIVALSPQPGFLQHLIALGERLLVRVLPARDPTEVTRYLQETSVDAIIVHLPEDAHLVLTPDFQRWWQAEGLRDLPVAFVCPGDQILRSRLDFHTDIDLVVPPPLDTAIFSQAVHHLASIGRISSSRVLLVEPEAAFTARLCDWLTDAEMEVDRRDAAAGILWELENLSPDALLLGPGAGGDDALELCRIVRALPRWQDLPILFLTEPLDEAQRLRTFRAGADDVMPRSVSRDELLTRLHSRLTRTRVQRERADRDILTGLLTRRAFVEHFAARLAESARHDRPLSFCLIDLDRFKSVNDTYGHLVGDQVLTVLGRLLRRRFRIEDLRGRWGGEEFAVVLLDEDAPTARRVVQRILNEFSAIEFPDDDGRGFCVTFSAGIAQYPVDGADTEALLACADRRLFEAKDLGRGRIVFDE